MAAPTYTTDLTLIDDGSGTFTEPTSATLGALSNADTDNFIQGTNACTKTTGASGAPALAGIGILDGAAHTISSPNAFYCWVFVGAGALIDTLANGGIRLLIGNTSANYRYWYVDGNEYFPYIGWQCIAIETDNGTVAADGSVGSPSATKQYFGAVFNCLINVGKGNPMAVDALRWGRTITILNGESANYATFAGIAAQNDNISNRWGQFQAVAGGYQLQGRLLFGTTGVTAVDSRDSNRSIVIAVSRKTATSFNAIEIQNTSSNIEWSACTFTALGTNSRGTLTVTDNCTVSIIGCSFTGMDTFTLKALTTMTGSVWRGCNAVTATGSDLNDCQILVPTVGADTAALVWTDATETDGLLDGMTFTKGTNAHHAIQFSTFAADYTLRGITFSGFNASDAQNDSTLYFPDTGSDRSWVINLVGCSGNISYKKVRSGDTVTLVTDPVTLNIHVQDIDSGSPIVGAQVWVVVGSSAGGEAYQAAVTSITRSGTTATCTTTSPHNLTTNDVVYIAGATQWQYNGTFVVTVTGASTFTYTMLSDPGATATGTPTVTFAPMSDANEVTDGSGDFSYTHSWSADQPITGRVRKASGAPYYKTAPISGTIDSVSGLSLTIQMIPDS